MSGNPQGSVKGKVSGLLRNKGTGKKASGKSQPDRGSSSSPPAPAQAKPSRRGRNKNSGSGAGDPALHPYGSPKAKRQTPKLVTKFIALVVAMLNGVQPFNSLMTFAGMLGIMQLAHIWHLMSWHGVLVGLVFIFLELLVLLFAIAAMHTSSAEKPGMVVVAMLLLLTMLALVVGVIRFYGDDIFSVIVMSAFVVSLADPAGFATSHIAFHRRVAALEAREKAHAAEVNAFHERRAEKMEAAYGHLSLAQDEREQARLELARTKESIAEQVQKEVVQHVTTVRDSFRDALGITQERDQLVQQQAALNTERRRVGRTQEQIREEVTAENRAEMDSLRATIDSLLEQNRKLGGSGFAVTPGTPPGAGRESRPA
jgi:hypothetical protein